ncbi:hypothetical protein BS50DRAFT_557292 [Corynespora cassiicola Philippines]|uniref:Aldehyde dehydrogenase domain-containing protein n=1 Tax=Corynespora cassiicola Philippines TaxID=1448308 RepID=A0A2T2NGT4_CORCC|nr:hypothetical protein BS50DRAFT_557292 [Corynespora cassiicola Philippines]
MSDSIVLSRISGGAIDGRLQILRIRQRLFKSLHNVLVNERENLLEAIQIDEGFTQEEAQVVFASALIELRNHYDQLDFQADLAQEYSVARKQSNESRRVPITMTYLIPDSFTLFYSVITALSAALEAGSCFIVEFDNTNSKTSALLKRIISSSLDQDAFGIVESRAPEVFLSKCAVVDQRPDGSNSKIPAQILLYSPKSRNVALVDRTCDIRLAAREIVTSRLAYNGASRYSVDLVLVNEFVAARFQSALIEELQHAQSNIAAKKSSSLAKKVVRSKFPTILEDDAKKGAVELVIGDSNVGAVNILNRSQIATQKIPSSRVVPCLKITSLDDAIDFLSTEPQQEFPIAAFYLFAAEREAKYLSQYIICRATYVNHIPAQLAIGPMAPPQYPANLRMRYTRDMFEEPSPQVVPGSRSHPVSTIFGKASFLVDLAQRPLKPTGQPPSGAWGFFEQGIIIGAIVYLLPMVGAVTCGIAYTGWTGYKKFWS